MSYKLFNFSYPITDVQLSEINSLLADSEHFPDNEVSFDASDIINIPTQIDASQPLQPQAQALIDQIKPHLSEYSYTYVRLPCHADLAAILTMLINEHNYPVAIRLAPVPDSTPPTFKVVEVLHFD